MHLKDREVVKYLVHSRYPQLWIRRTKNTFQTYGIVSSLPRSFTRMGIPYNLPKLGIHKSKIEQFVMPFLISKFSLQKGKDLILLNP